jgi:hypothetical protein
VSKYRDIGIMIGSCADDPTRKERETEATALWKELVSIGSYRSTYIVLDKPYFLYREALNCYGTCAYMATAIMCRSTLEAGLYDFVTAKDLKWRTEGVGRQIYTYRYSECAPYLTDYNNALSELKRSYPDLFKETNEELQKAREAGNFAAHYLPVSERKFVKAFKNPSQTVELWIDKERAFHVLKSTGNILMRFAEVLEKSCPS